MCLYYYIEFDSYLRSVTLNNKSTARSHEPLYNNSIQHHCLQEFLSKNAVIRNRNCLSKTFDFEVTSWSEIVFKHGADHS